MFRKHYHRSIAAALLAMCAPPLRGEVYRIEFQGNTLNPAHPEAFAGSYLLDTKNPYAELPFTIETDKSRTTLTNLIAGIGTSALSVTASNFNQFDPLNIDFYYAPHGYSNGPGVLDPSDLPSQLPFFPASGPDAALHFGSDTAAAATVTYGNYSQVFNYSDRGRVTSVMAEKISADSLTDGAATSSRLIAQYAPWISNVASAASTLYGKLASALDAYSIALEGGAGLNASARRAMVNAAIDSVVERTENRDLAEASLFVNAAKTLAGSVRSNPAATTYSLMSLVSSYEAETFHRIANDPADDAYGSIYVPSVHTLSDLATGSPLDPFLLITLNHLLQYNGSLVALLHSVERYDGAYDAGSIDSRVLQYAAFELYRDAAMRDASLVANDFGLLQQAGLDLDLSGSLQAGYLSALKTQCDLGFTTSEMSTLAGLGFNGTSSSLSVCSSTPPMQSDPDLNGIIADVRSNALAFSRGENVIAAAPEPATWASLVMGFLFVGAAIRRERAVGSPIART